MSEPAFRSSRSAEPSPVESLDHLLGRRTPLSPPNMGSSLPGPEEAGEWRRELDLARVELLMAIDSVAGAEAERGAALGRVRDLEHQHHMLSVERDELRREVERLSRTSASRKIAAAVVRRLRSKRRVQ